MRFPIAVLLSVILAIDSRAAPLKPVKMTKDVVTSKAGIGGLALLTGVGIGAFGTKYHQDSVRTKHLESKLNDAREQIAEVRQDGGRILVYHIDAEGKVQPGVNPATGGRAWMGVDNAGDPMYRRGWNALAAAQKDGRDIDHILRVGSDYDMGIVDQFKNILKHPEEFGVVIDHV